MIYLFYARPKFQVVGMTSSTEVQQVRALELLFRLLRRCPSHLSDFQAMAGYRMLRKVLTSSRCKLGFRMLQVESHSLNHQSHCCKEIL